jgi:hypothetical protein
MSSFFLDPSIPLIMQKIHIQAVSTLNLESVDLWLDGKFLTTLVEPNFETWWQLEIGDHFIWVETLLNNGDSLRSPTISINVMDRPQK